MSYTYYKDDWKNIYRVDGRNVQNYNFLRHIWNNVFNSTAALDCIHDGEWEEITETDVFTEMI